MNAHHSTHGYRQGSLGWHNLDHFSPWVIYSNVKREPMTQLWEKQVAEQTQWFSSHFLASLRPCMLAAVLYTKQQGTTNTLWHEKVGQCEAGPLSRGIQSVQTQQITAAAGRYSLKTTAPTANCMPRQLWRPKQHSRQRSLLLLYLHCCAGGSFPEPQTPRKQEGNSAEYTVSVGVKIVSEQEKNCAVIAVVQNMATDVAGDF